MDVTASIINVVQLTGTLVEYLRAATQAPSDRRKLLLEANTLLALLTSLGDFVSVEHQDDHLQWRRAVHQLEAPGGPFAQYKHGLETLLNKLLPRRQLAKAAQTLLWKLDRDDIKETLLRIERMKSLISISLEMDHTRLSEAILGELSTVSTEIHGIKDEMTELKHEVRKFVETHQLVKSLDKASFRALLDEICPEDYLSVFQSNLTEHTAGIGRNFIADPAFQSWSGSGDTKVLLCPGDPGVGKTVMATKAIQALQNKAKGFNEAVIFVYCDYTRRRSRLTRRDSSPEARSKGVQTSRHFLASFLRQLVAKVGSPSARLLDLMKWHERHRTKPKTEELERAFSDIAAALGRVYIVVDAMDECDSLEIEGFASLLLSICALSHVRLLMTCRRHPGIEQMFEGSVRLEMRAYDDDILQYLQSRARKEFPKRLLRDSNGLDRVLQALIISANGIPLIARLHLNALRGVRTPGAMLAEIARLRSDSDIYDDTYRAAMERIMKQPGELPLMAKRVLQWVAASKRYLYTRELQCVLAMRDDSSSLDEDFVPDMDDIFLACEGLICPVSDPEDDAVRLELVHTTARQHFEKHLAEWAPDVGLNLARTCLNVLSFEDLVPVPRSLVGYAWRYWGQHAKDVEELDEDIQFSVLKSDIKRFFAAGRAGSPLAQEVTVRDKRECPVNAYRLTGYHLVARFGLTRIFEALWSAEDDLDLVMRYRRSDVTYLSGLDNMTPLMTSIHHRHGQTVEAMLRLNAVNSNTKNWSGQSPLYHAVMAGEEEIVEALLRTTTVDPNQADFVGRPTVFLAALLGHERIVECLLNAAEFDPRARKGYGASLLAMAASSHKQRCFEAPLTMRVDGLDEKPTLCFARADPLSEGSIDSRLISSII